MPPPLSSATNISISSSSTTTTTTTTSFAPFPPNYKDPSFRLPTRRFLVNVPRVLCSASSGAQNHSSGKVDRRDVLIGLGSLYGASTLTPNSFALAAPLETPRISIGGPPDLPPNTQPTDWRQPLTSNIIDFRPPAPEKPRVRPAAHLVDKNYIEKYSRAVEIMKGLPDDDPRSFVQQANLHCAFCNGAYDQFGISDAEVQSHGSLLFFPFHRYYLYFHEKILGELIGDPTFALPFWNYDAPAGMMVPPIYADEKSSLYDELRSADHQPPTLIDLDCGGVDPTTDDETQIRRNLRIMYRQMVSNNSTPSLFFDSFNRAGDKPSSPGGGGVGNIPHRPVQLWCSDNNIGNFYSAARDPIFFADHSNIDRMWSIWKTLGGKRRDIQNPDWLNSSFLFYNEKAEAVRARVRDCLDTRNLGYVYQDVEIPWLESRPLKTKRAATKVPFGIGAALAGETGSSSTGAKKPGSVKFPITLQSVTSTEVKRPRKSRSKKEKDEEEEVLAINGITFDPTTTIKFDVLINNEDGKEIRVDNIEFAGSFVNLPHRQRNKNCITRFKTGINQLLEDLEAEDDESLVVTLVPRLGIGLVTIGGIEIEFDK